MESQEVVMWTMVLLVKLRVDLQHIVDDFGREYVKMSLKINADKRDKG